MKLYIADLADYNAGRLEGFWLDLDGKDKDDALGEIAEFLRQRSAADPDEVHEEWAIHDTEEAPELGEHDLDGYCAVQAALDEVGEDEAPALLAYADNRGGRDWESLADDFRDAFMGTWDSEQDYAESLADDSDIFHGVPEGSPARLYFDYEAWARDLFMGDYYSLPADGGGVWVFSNV